MFWRSTLWEGRKAHYWNVGGKGILVTHWLTKGKDTRALEPCLLAHNCIPELQRWKNEDQEIKISFDYIGSLRLAWST